VKRNNTLRLRILRYAAQHDQVSTPDVMLALNLPRSSIAPLLSGLAHEGLLTRDGVVAASGRLLYRLSPRGREWLHERVPMKPDAGPLSAALGYRR
jgi:DNA-binding IclR family transcriptional regulator